MRTRLLLLIVAMLAVAGCWSSVAQDAAPTSSKTLSENPAALCLPAGNGGKAGQMVACASSDVPDGRLMAFIRPSLGDDSVPETWTDLMRLKATPEEELSQYGLSPDNDDFERYDEPLCLEQGQGVAVTCAGTEYCKDGCRMAHVMDGEWQFYRNQPQADRSMDACDVQQFLEDYRLVSFLEGGPRNLAAEQCG